MRYRFLWFLRRRVFRVPEGASSPKVVFWIYRILFPIASIYARQKDFRYDPTTDMYYVRGLLISGSIIDLLRDCSIGMCFIVEGGVDGVPIISVYRPKQESVSLN